ncbi:hypothetical protein [Endozoicomonas sp. ALC020]|uniref:hypothetical protein n=1 Tax=unclassified Endozoicomonas TaxID=2644528 RepID=UPI003BAE783F
MKNAGPLTMVRLFFLFILSVILPLSGHCAFYTSLLSWSDWGSFSKVTDTSGEINKLSFRDNKPPLLLTYDRKAVDENAKTVSELANNQLYVILDSQPGDQFNFCFRTPPVLSTGNYPTPPVIKKPVTGQGMPDIQNGSVIRVASTPDSVRWQHEYSVRWRLPAGHQSLVLTIEDNENGWVIEPQCSGLFSESAALPSSSGINTSANKKTSFVDIFYRNKQAVKNGPGHSDVSSRFSGIPGAADTADNSKPYTSSGGGGVGGNDDLDDLFKKRPGSGMGPLYSFEWTSEHVSRMTLIPGTDGQTVKKQIWDTRIVLKIKQGWNEQAIIISQELWDKIRGANLERSSGLFLALSRNPDNPEAVFDHYQNSNLSQPLQTADYRRYAQQEFIFSPKQLLSVSVFPGYVPTGIGHSGGTTQAGKQTANVGPPSYAQYQREYGRQNRGSRSGSESDGDDGSGGSSDNGLCLICNKPVLAFDKCKECLDRESSELEQEPTKEQLPATGQDKEVPGSGNIFAEQESTEELSAATGQDSEEPVSGTEEADPSAIHVFEWFKTLDSDGRQRDDCFRINDNYKLPELYRLLTQSFVSDKNALSKFHSKWVKFLNGSMCLYHLVSEVGELAKSQGIEDYVEVTRIVKALAIHRDVFENETSWKQFRNELLDYLTTNNLLASDDPGKVFYSGLDQREKSELINFIFEIFSEASLWLNDEKVPSRFVTIAMLNKLARDVYAKYGFGLPDTDMDYENLSGIIMWGCASFGRYSFITRYNRKYLGRHASETLHFTGLRVTSDENDDFIDVEAMYTAMVLIRSMHGQRLRDMFPEHVSFAEGVPSEQLELLENFSIKANEQLVKLLEAAEPEKKDKFIHSMFLIFGMVPRELSNELSDPETVPSTQAVAYATAHLTLDSTVAEDELLSIGSKPGID